MFSDLILLKLFLWCLCGLHGLFSVDVNGFWAVRDFRLTVLLDWWCFIYGCTLLTSIKKSKHLLFSLFPLMKGQKVFPKKDFLLSLTRKSLLQNGPNDSINSGLGSNSKSVSGPFEKSCYCWKLVSILIRSNVKIESYKMTTLQNTIQFSNICYWWYLNQSLQNQTVPIP